jgi:hypothetical protein
MEMNATGAKETPRNIISEDNQTTSYYSHPGWAGFD